MMAFERDINTMTEMRSTSTYSSLSGDVGGNRLTMQTIGKKPATRPAKTEERQPDDPEQSRRFLEAAQEAQADETAKGADRAFRKVVRKAKPDARSR